MEELIRKYTLKNFYDYGKANAGSILGKIIAEKPEVKNNIKEVMEKINKTINEVGKLSKNEIEEELKKYEFSEKKEEKKQITLPNAEKGKVVTRFPPEPSGYLHIGHAKAVWLDYSAAKNYSGKMVLRFDDTNPTKAKWEYVNNIKKDLEWLGITWDDETFTSDHLDQIYEVLKQLLKIKKAYVCICSSKEIKENRANKKTCACREKGLAWEEFASKSEGEAIIRYKGDFNSKNTVMHDPTLARIIEMKHYKQEDLYKIWPSYDIAVVFMDHIEGITHSMRSKEYELRDELYLSLCKDLGWKPPELIGFSRLSIKNAPISKRLIVPLVEKNIVKGWDDPRLPTLAGLRKRGILPEAIKEFVLSFGLSKVESEPGWEILLAFNRKLLDPIAPHYFFVPNPIELTLINWKKETLQLKLHPKKELGVRTINTKNKVYVPKDDLKEINAGEIFRLKEWCNVKIIEKQEEKIIGEIIKTEEKPRLKIQWVCEGEQTKIVKPGDLFINDELNPNSLEEIKGIVEKEAMKLKNETIVQFERVGFCKKDEEGFIFSC